MSRRTVPACFASWSKQLDSETRRNRLTHQNSFLARSKSITIVKWISHEWRIILQSSFLCHPLNGHGIDHEAISMRKCNSERDSCQLLCRFTPVVFASTVRMMANKNKSRRDTRMGIVNRWCSNCCALITRLYKQSSSAVSSDSPSIQLHLNCTRCEISIKECKAINCIQIEARVDQAATTRGR